jgi:hypothetical protein
VVSIKNTLIFIDYSTNFGGAHVQLMLTASTNGLALDGGLDGPETVGDRKNNSTFGSGIPVHNGSCDHAQTLQLDLTATHQVSDPID